MTIWPFEHYLLAGLDAITSVLMPGVREDDVECCQLQRLIARSWRDVDVPDRNAPCSESDDRIDDFGLNFGSLRAAVARAKQTGRSWPCRLQERGEPDSARAGRRVNPWRGVVFAMVTSMVALSACRLTTTTVRTGRRLHLAPADDTGNSVRVGKAKVSRDSHDSLPPGPGRITTHLWPSAVGSLPSIANITLGQAAGLAPSACPRRPSKGSDAVVAAAGSFEWPCKRRPRAATRLQQPHASRRDLLSRHAHAPYCPPFRRPFVCCSCRHSCIIHH